MLTLSCRRALLALAGVCFYATPEAAPYGTGRLRPRYNPRNTADPIGETHDWPRQQRQIAATDSKPPPHPQQKPPEEECVAIYTRGSLVDFPYAESWLDHYRLLGISMVFVLQTADDPQVPHLQANFGTDFARFHRVKNTRNSAFADSEHLLRGSGCDWALVIDMDEYLVLDPQYGRIQDFIAAKEDAHGRLDAFQFHWLMHERLAPTCSDRPLREQMLSASLRGDLHLKTMSRISSLLDGASAMEHQHFALLKPGSRVFKEGQVDTHYTKSKFRLSRESFTDHALFHMHTRSLLGMLAKALLPVKDNLSVGGSSQDFSCLKSLIQGNSSQTYAEYMKCVGVKAQLALAFTGCWQAEPLRREGRLVCQKRRRGRVAGVQPVTQVMSATAQRPEHLSTAPVCDRNAEAQLVMQLMSKASDLKSISQTQLVSALSAVSADIAKLAQQCCVGTNLL